MSEDLATWLPEQIAEDELLARDGQSACAHLDLCHDGGSDYFEAFGFDKGPERVLAECDAKRRIVERHRHFDFAYVGDTGGMSEYATQPTCDYCHQPWPCPDLRDAGASYVGRPGYRDEWRPDTPG
jgi:hypothetical protein